MTKQGWDVYFSPALCGGTTQPGYVIRHRGRWWRTNYRYYQGHHGDVLSMADAERIRRALPRLPHGNALFHEYLQRARKSWSEVPLFPLRELGEEV